MNKQWWGWWLETSWCPLWRHSNVFRCNGYNVCWTVLIKGVHDFVFWSVANGSIYNQCRSFLAFIMLWDIFNNSYGVSVNLSRKQCKQLFLAYCKWCDIRTIGIDSMQVKPSMWWNTWTPLLIIRPWVCGGNYIYTYICQRVVQVHFTNWYIEHWYIEHFL